MLNESQMQRVMEIADALIASDGKDAAGASTGERIAGALLANRPEWGNWGHVIDCIDRLGPEWLDGIIRLHRSGIWPHSAEESLHSDEGH